MSTNLKIFIFIKFIIVCLCLSHYSYAKGRGGRGGRGRVSRSHSHNHKSKNDSSFMPYAWKPNNHSKDTYVELKFENKTLEAKVAMAYLDETYADKISEEKVAIGLYDINYDYQNEIFVYITRLNVNSKEDPILIILRSSGKPLIWNDSGIYKNSINISYKSIKILPEHYNNYHDIKLYNKGNPNIWCYDGKAYNIISNN